MRSEPGSSCPGDPTSGNRWDFLLSSSLPRSYPYFLSFSFQFVFFSVLFSPPFFVYLFISFILPLCLFLLRFSSFLLFSFLIRPCFFVLVFHFQWFPPDSHSQQASSHSTQLTVSNLQIHHRNHKTHNRALSIIISSYPIPPRPILATHTHTFDLSWYFFRSGFRQQ